MRDFEDSTLWRVSGYERVRMLTGTSGFARLEGPTVLPTTLLTDLLHVDSFDGNLDVLEVAAACMRHIQILVDRVHMPQIGQQRGGQHGGPFQAREAACAGQQSHALVLAHAPQGRILEITHSPIVAKQKSTCRLNVYKS